MSMSKPDFNYIKTRAISIIKDPKGFWASIRAEDFDIPRIYQDYLAPLAAIPAICGFIGGSIVGVSMPVVGTFRVPIFSGLVNGIIGYLGGLLCIYVGAMVIEFVASKSGLSISKVKAFRLLAYSYTPAFVAGALTIIPALAPIGLLGGLYSFYVYYNGLSIYGEVPSEKQNQFFVLSLLSVMIAGALVMGLCAVLLPHQSPPNF